MATIYAAATDSQVTSAQSGDGDEWDRANIGKIIGVD